MKGKLSNREKLFCLYYTQSRNAKEAAVKSGFTMFAEKSGLRLLEKSQIREEISRCISKTNFNGDAVAGLKRLAFSNINDAVKLIYSGDDVLEEIGALDLFNVSEMKRPKGGGMEIKFFDRVKALEKLGAVTESREEASTLPFYEALEKSGKKIKDYLGGEKNGD